MNSVAPGMEVIVGLFRMSVLTAKVHDMITGPSRLRSKGADELTVVVCHHPFLGYRVVIIAAARSVALNS